jgi:hypothetical protein
MDARFILSATPSAHRHPQRTLPNALAQYIKEAGTPTPAFYTFLNALTRPIPKEVKTVATLPAAASNTGVSYIVTDANATTFMSTVASGGSNIVPVFSNGTLWKIG